MIDTSPNITRLMDKLLEKNLIIRNHSHLDRRVVYVVITEKSLILLTKIDKLGELEFLNNLTEKKASILSNLLDKIR
jgi:DNA-binding MarR family transcriptional regulator